jgi:DNA-directed RNA polymerase II subunit RPB2
MDDQLTWRIIDKYFKDNPYSLVSHHLDSYNDFFNNGIKRIFKEKNPIKIMKEQNEKTNDFDLKCELYLGGKNGDKLYFGKPIIYDEYREHYMYPNEARLRNMTYGTTIHFDVDVDFYIMENEEVVKQSITLEKIYLGKFPIMLGSDLCILKNMPKQVRFNMGECRNDIGGYFIIDGLERTIIPQEKFADNMLYIRDKVNDLYSHSAEIRSVSEDASKPMRTTSVRIMAPNSKYKNGQILVEIPNVKMPVPLFIVMRALGIEPDKQIIQYCLLDIKKYKNYIDLFIPSIHDAGKIFNQVNALQFISSLTKSKTIPSTLHILSDYFLPHIGELNFQDKAYFLGYMTFELLKVYNNDKSPTDRDSFKYKRVELAGMLMYDLFKEYYTLYQKNIYQSIDKEYYYNKAMYQGNFIGLIELNYKDYFNKRIVEDGFKKAFKGSWGAEEHTKKMGVVQPINRLSYNSFISHLRKLNLAMDASAKIVKPRLLHSSQWGIIDPVDTPDGGNVGLHKHLSITTKITNGYPSIDMIKWMRNYTNMLYLSECSPQYLSKLTKVFVNGKWVGVISNPEEITIMMKQYKRNALFPIYTSIHWNIDMNELIIYTDAGRLCRPIYYFDEMSKKISFKKDFIYNKLKTNNFSWVELVTGFNNKRTLPSTTTNDIQKNEYINIDRIYEKPNDLYNVNTLRELNDAQCVIEYIDTSETETSLISLYPNVDEFDKKKYTHYEIHPSLLLGVLGNQIVFPENNQLPRDVFACGQSKQAVALYHSNYQSRFDKMGVILNYGQIPLIKSRYMKYIHNEEHPYGENVVVAISCYTGYNVEDSILINQGSINRGLFRTTYYSMYETREESSKVGKVNVDTVFTNIEKENVVGMKPGYDYSQLDAYGLVKENTEVNDKKVLIGKVLKNINTPNVYIDKSEFPKKGQLGFVDKSFITEGEEGFRIAKVRIREERLPAIGDKFCSRCGQKGTIGLIIPEEDMPFTSNGIKPDIIINPHALPSRMTIGQLIETLMGKACSIYGGFGDCTAFVNKGTTHKRFGELLNNIGLNSTGYELLYNGMTGEQIQTEIFIGPTYYMRLKHMVKDKINYRAQGPRTALTRQTVQGRSNDGGLRIGEMERDGIIAHGATKFLNESMMVRGDEYYMAICNQTGTIAIYNKSQNLFLSPQADGPIEFDNITDFNANVMNISRFGREFSIVRIPYSFKLLIQELKTMNIEMKIITEDNIDQLESMSFSNNINKLTNKDVYDIIKTNREKIKNAIDINRDIMKLKINYDKEEKLSSAEVKQGVLKTNSPLILSSSITPEISPPYVPVTPPSEPSPPYVPVTPPSPTSPPYVPVTPPSPTSPPYIPVSPGGFQSYVPVISYVPQKSPITSQNISNITQQIQEKQQSGGDMLNTSILNKNLEQIKEGIIKLNDKINNNEEIKSNKINTFDITNDTILTTYSHNNLNNNTINENNDENSSNNNYKKIIL